MSKIRVLTIVFALFLMPPAQSPPARAMDYPTRPVTIVVPFAPGGYTDLLARLVAQRLSERLGKSFVVENKPGGGTVVAAVAVSRAAPDGYTLLMVPNGTIATNPTLYKSLPYDRFKIHARITGGVWASCLDGEPRRAGQNCLRARQARQGQAGQS